MDTQTQTSPRSTAAAAALARQVLMRQVQWYATDFIRNPAYRYDRGPHKIGVDADAILAAHVLTGRNIDGIYLSLDLDSPSLYVIAVDEDGHEHDLARLPVTVSDPVWY